MRTAPFNDLDKANDAYERAIGYVNEIYRILDHIQQQGDSDLLLGSIQQTRQSTNEYKSLYLTAVSLLTELNKQAVSLELEGETITSKIQAYVEAKRVEIKKELNQKTIEKINNGSNIWQYTYVTRLDEKKYRLSPDKEIFNAFENNYAFMMSEWQRLKENSDQPFEF